MVAALIVVLAAATAITTLRQQADKVSRAENLLIHLQAQAYRLSSLEDYTISEQKLDVETSEQVQAVRSQLEQIEDIYRTYDLGVNSFITKPVMFESLVEVMMGLGRYWFVIVELPPESLGD